MAHRHRSHILLPEHSVVHRHLHFNHPPIPLQAEYISNVLHGPGRVSLYVCCGKSVFLYSSFQPMLIWATRSSRESPAPAVLASPSDRLKHRHNPHHDMRIRRSSHRTVAPPRHGSPVLGLRRCLHGCQCMHLSHPLVYPVSRLIPQPLPTFLPTIPPTLLPTPLVTLNKHQPQPQPYTNPITAHFPFTL